jgi:hypothetical protein
MASVTTMGYFDFLAGPPFIGFTAQLLGLRSALGIIVATSLLIVMLAPAVGGGWSSAKRILQPRLSTDRKWSLTNPGKRSLEIGENNSTTNWVCSPPQNPGRERLNTN